MFETIDDKRPGRSPYDVDAEDLSDDALIDAIATSAAHIAVAECHHLLLIAELDRRGIWGGPGTRSAAHWLNWRCGTSLSTAREQVRVGRALEYLPRIRQAFVSGQISYSKARAITRVATNDTEQELLNMARWGTAAQLELIISRFRQASATEGLEALEKHRNRFCRTHTDDDGMVMLHGRFAPEEAAVVLAALDEARRAILRDREPKEVESPSPGIPEGDQNASAETFTNETSTEEPEDQASTATDVSAETSPQEDDLGVGAPLTVQAPTDETGEATQVDALVEICRAVLAKGLTDAEHEPRPSVIVHIDEQVLANPSADGCSYAEGVGKIAAHTARRLACDAGITPLVYRVNGDVEQVGKTRSIPSRMRRAVLVRDDGCRWPGCTNQRFVEVHHVVFWSHGGLSYGIGE